MFDFFGGGQRAYAQFFDPKRAIVIRIERDARVIVGVHPQHFLRDEFQREQQFRAIAQQEFDVIAFEFYEKIGIFEVRIRMVARFEPKAEAKARVVDYLPEKLLDPGSCFVNRIPYAQVRFLLSFDELSFFCEVAITVTGEAVLLKNHCCPI